MRLIRLLSVTAASMLILGFAGCATAPKTEEAKSEMQNSAQAALDKFKAADPAVASQLNNAYGYAIFPEVGKGGFIAGAAYGRGEVMEQGKLVGYADIRQGSVGAQIGGETFRELVIFQTNEALHKLKNNNFTFGADATAVMVESGKSAATEFKNGVAVYTMPIKGAMVSAAITGQKFVFVPADVANADMSTTRPAGKMETETRTTTEQPVRTETETKTKTSSP
jgi:lipid-binding SYLF domain-containing protein